MTDFSQQVGDYLERLGDLRQRGASEDSIRDAFLNFLRTTFPRLERLEPILLEKYIPALQVRGGFADALYGDLIFEFKKRLDEGSRDDGLEKLGRYIGNQRHPERYLGILTDGEAFEVYVFQEGERTKTDELRLEVDSAAEAKTWLDCYLFHEKNLIPTANDVALRFGDRSPSFWHSLRILRDLWRRLGPDAALQTKFAEWQSLLSIVYGSAVGDEGLFLRHTYLALFARVLAFVALEHRAPDTDQVSGIITGDAFERLGLQDFVGDDFFAWIDQPRAIREARVLLRALATRLTAAYDLTAIREDLLKELYQELVDPETRHDLGEFYTPDWLAELTLRKAGFPPRKRSDVLSSLLDPACGSGTFLFTAVRLLREAGRKRGALVDFCSQHLAGLDVHPLAVTIAKTNLVLALGDDLRGYQRRFALPVYMADSLSPGRPKVKPVAEKDAIRVPVDVMTLAERAGKPKPSKMYPVFELPLALADTPEVFHESLNALLDFSKPQGGETDALEGLRRRLNDLGVPGAQWHYWASNFRLMRWLLEPPATDSVWRFVLRNAYQPELLARRKFAFVVGNPPWLSYRYIKRADYQDRVRKLVFDYGLLDAGDAHLFTHMELATLFFAYCADRYLSPAGTIAFVMPRSVLTGAKQHTAYRNDYVARASLLIDCEQVAPLFNVPACVVIWPTDQPAARTRGSVPTLRLQGQLPSRNCSLTLAETHWRASETTYEPPKRGRKSAYLEQVIQGASLGPRCLWFVRPPQTAKVIDSRRPQLETDEAIERQAKKPWKGIRVTGAVESDFLFATLLSDNMLPFGWRQFSLIVLPVAADWRGDMELLTIDAATRRGKAGLFDWLRKAEDFWLRHRKSSAALLDWINWQNKLTRQHPTGKAKLVYNAGGTHLCACVVDPRQVRRGHVYGLPLQGFVADTKTYSLETKELDEAHYICSTLNAHCVDDAIKPYQTKGAFGAQTGKGERDIHRRPFEVLPIPRFDQRDTRHRELAKLSRHCHEKVGAFLADPDERWRTGRIGRLRTELRAELLKDELDKIDIVVSEMLKREVAPQTLETRGKPNAQSGDEMRGFLKRFWRHPFWQDVSSRTIAILLSSAILVPGAVFLALFTPFLSWLAEDVGVTRWSYYLLLLSLLGCVLCLLHRIVKTRLRKPPPAFWEYKKDKFGPIVWRWGYRDTDDDIHDMAPFCPKCDTQLVLQDEWEDTLLVCGTHGIVHRSEESYGDIQTFVRHAIEKMIRSGEYPKD